MSILIKGMKMPKENAICIVIFPDGKVTSQFGVPYLGTAVPVPPHGALIDRDALMQHKVLLLMDGGHLPIVYTSYVRNAPTIIPAEE